MHVEFRNRNTAKCYYLCYGPDDYAGVTWTPHIREHIADLRKDMSVRELFDLIRPIVDRLSADNDDSWEVKLFTINNTPIQSLTEPLVTIHGHWAVSGKWFINGIPQPTKFISL